MTEREKQHAEEYIEGIRAMADFFELHPELVPSGGSVTVNLFPKSLAEVARGGYGKLEKREKGKWFCLARNFSPSVAVEWNQPREEVCKRIKVGTTIVPAQPAVPEHEVDVFEWHCPPSLLKTDDEGLHPPETLVQ